jgi:hypothetical protein
VGDAPKPVYLTWHAKRGLQRRGATEEDVIEAIRTAEWAPSGHGRLECWKSYPHRPLGNGAWDDAKQIRPIFVQQANEIVVVTVYVYFF